MPPTSVQHHLDLSSIQDGVGRFGSGPGVEYCAVLEVAGAQQSIARLDAAKQEELLAAYAQFLNGLTFPFQLLVRVTPIDLAWYVVRVEERARMLSPGLVAVARDHAAFVLALTRQRTLLERRIYVVVPWSGRQLEAGDANAARPWLSLFGRRGRSRGWNDDSETYMEETIARRLADRCDDIARQLGRAGLRTIRLDDLALAQLFHACWAPELARTQRLRRELGEYTALVVQAGANRQPRETLGERAIVSMRQPSASSDRTPRTAP